MSEDIQENKKKAKVKKTVLLIAAFLLMVCSFLARVERFGFQPGLVTGIFWIASYVCCQFYIFIKMAEYDRPLTLEKPFLACYNLVLGILFASVIFIINYYIVFYTLPFALGLVFLSTA